MNQVLCNCWKSGTGQVAVVSQGVCFQKASAVVCFKLFLCALFLQLRMEYLSLMHAIIRSTPYLQHKHRFTDLQGILQRIMMEEDESQQCQMDRVIIREIYKEFPEISAGAS